MISERVKYQNYHEVHSNNDFYSEFGLARYLND